MAVFVIIILLINKPVMSINTSFDQDGDTSGDNLDLTQVGQPVIETYEINNPPTDLIESESFWKYNTSVYPTWETQQFDDSAWSEVDLPIGYGRNGIGTIVNETERIVYLRNTFQISDLGSIDTLNLNATWDDAVLVYINGYKIYSDNIPANWQGESLNSNERQLEVDLSTSIKYLKEGTNSISIQLINKDGNSSDLYLDAVLRANTRIEQPYLHGVGAGVHTFIDAAAGDLLHIDSYLAWGSGIGEIEITTPNFETTVLQINGSENRRPEWTIQLNITGIYQIRSYAPRIYTDFMLEPIDDEFQRRIAANLLPHKWSMKLDPSTQIVTYLPEEKTTTLVSHNGHSDRSISVNFTSNNAQINHTHPGENNVEDFEQSTNATVMGIIGINAISSVESTGSFSAWIESDHFSHPATHYQLPVSSTIQTWMQVRFPGEYSIQSGMLYDEPISRDFKMGVNWDTGGDPQSQDTVNELELLNSFGISVARTWPQWNWREGNEGIFVNDNNDPFSFNWDGFSFEGFTQQMNFLSENNMQTVLTVDWEPEDSFLTTHPAYWNQTEIDEFGEFILALVIRSKAPDLISNEYSPSDTLEAVEFLEILNEPDIELMNELSPSDSIDRYLKIFGDVASRIKNHPDPRVAEMKITAPNIGWNPENHHQYIQNWTAAMLDSYDTYIDVINYHEYEYYFPEDSDRILEDNDIIRSTLNRHGDLIDDEEIIMTEFNLRGGIPTSWEYYDSLHAVTADLGKYMYSAYAGFSSSLFFKFRDSDNEPRLKGLVTAKDTSQYAPYSHNTADTVKPLGTALELYQEFLAASNYNYHFNQFQNLDLLWFNQDGKTTVFVNNRQIFDVQYTLNEWEDVERIESIPSSLAVDPSNSVVRQIVVSANSIKIPAYQVGIIVIQDTEANSGIISIPPANSFNLFELLEIILFIIALILFIAYIIRKREQ